MYNVMIYVPNSAVPTDRGCAPAICALKQTESLSREKFNPTIVSSREHLNKIGKYKEIPIFRFEHSKLYRRLFKKWTKLDPYPLEKILAKYVRKLKVDIVHIHQIEFNVKKFRKYNNKIPVILHMHNLDRSFNPSKLGVASHYVAASDTIKRHMINTNFPENKISVVSNGVDDQVFKPLDSKLIKKLRDKYNIAPNQFVIAFVGRKTYKKGFHTFLMTLNELKNKGYSVFGVAIGLDLKEFLDNKAYSNYQKLKEHMIELGMLYDYSPMLQENINEWFNIADVVMAPSLTEPQGMVMIEAMSSEALLLSNRVEGIAQSVIDKKTGLLFDDFENYNKYSETIIEIIKKPEKYQPIKHQAREHILEHYTWSKWSKVLENIYENITN